MTNKEASEDYILAEERKFLGEEIGEMFVEPEKQVSGYDNMKVELLSPISNQAYIDWVDSAFYASLCTWDKSPQLPVSTMMFSKAPEEREAMLFNILKDRPISVALEGVIFAFKITDVPRSLTHQIVRHRQMAFGQQSYRVSSCYSDPVRIPQSLLDAARDVKGEDAEGANILFNDFVDAVQQVRKVYKNLIKFGIPMEQARNIMPMGTCTKIAVTMRLRDLIDYVKGRTGEIAMDEHTYLVCLMLKELKEKQPNFYKVVLRFAPKIEETMAKYLPNK